MLGGGAFGSDSGWVFDAMRRTLRLVENAALEVRIVSYGQLSETRNGSLRRSAKASSAGV